MNHCGYDELLRVPFLMRCPKAVTAGKTNQALLSNIDMLPTVLDVLGVEAPEKLDGQSFKPLLKNPAATHREEVFCNSGEHNCTVVVGAWKYVLNWNPRDLDELYQLEEDPGELPQSRPSP